MARRHRLKVKLACRFLATLPLKSITDYLQDSLLAHGGAFHKRTANMLLTNAWESVVRKGNSKHFKNSVLNGRV